MINKDMKNILTNFTTVILTQLFSFNFHQIKKTIFKVVQILSSMLVNLELW